MNLGETIYRLRTERNMSQGELAAALDVSRQSVSKWENSNAVPDLEKLIRIARLFDISLDELVGISSSAEKEHRIPSAQEIPLEPVPRREPVSFRRLGGIVLILTGLLFLLMAVNSATHGGLYINLLFFTTLCGCGTVTLLCRRPLLPCGWLLCGALFVFVFAIVSRWERYPLLHILPWGSLCLMYFLTVLAHRRGQLRIPGWLWIAGALLVAAGLILYLANTLPLDSGFVSEATHVPLPESGK